MKIKDITVPIRKKFIKGSKGDSFSSGSLSSGLGNRLLGGRNLVLGDYTTITNLKNIVVGDYTGVQGVNNFVLGNYSSIAGAKTKASMIIGDGNVIEWGSSYLDVKGLSNSLPREAYNVSVNGDNNNFNFGTGSSFSSVLIKSLTLVGDNNEIGKVTSVPVGATATYINLNNVNVYGDGNSIGLSSSYLNVFGENNSVGSNVRNLDIKGDNNVVPDGLVNVSIFGNNQTAVSSNTIIIDSAISTNIRTMTGQDGQYVSVDSTINGPNRTSLTSIDGSDYYQFVTDGDNFYVQMAAALNSFELGPTITKFQNTDIIDTITSGSTTTTNATPVDIGPLPTTSTDVLFVNVIIFGQSTTKSYVRKIQNVYRTLSGTLNDIGNLFDNVITDFSTATANLQIVSNQLYVRVTGELATTINWEVNYEFVRRNP